MVMARAGLKIRNSREPGFAVVFVAGAIVVELTSMVDEGLRCLAKPPAQAKPLRELCNGATGRSH